MHKIPTVQADLNKYISLIILTFGLSFPVFSTAADSTHSEEKELEVGELIFEHVLDAHDWHIGDNYSGVATLEYVVDFSFAKQQWPVGNEQVALAVDGGLYTTGLPIFVYGSEINNLHVRVDVPDEWEVATAWQELDTHNFLVEDLNRASGY